MKRLISLAISLSLIVAGAITSYASVFRSEVEIPKTGGYVLAFEELKELIGGSEIYSISSDPPGSVSILIDAHDSPSPYIESTAMSGPETVDHDVVCYLETGEGFTSAVYFQMPVSRFIYTVDIYYETAPNTYARLRSDLSLYNLPEGDSSLLVILLKEEGVKYKVIFKDALFKMETEEPLKAILFKQDSLLVFDSFLDPIEIYEKSAGNDTFEYMYDFGAMVFIDDIDIKDRITKMYTSRDSQVFVTSSVTDIGSGLYTRYLKITVGSRLTQRPLFSSYTRYLLVEGSKDRQVILKVNSSDSLSMSDIKSMNGYADDYMVLDTPVFSEIDDPDERNASDYMIVLIFAAAAVFLVYPGYLLFRYIRLRFFK